MMPPTLLMCLLSVMGQVGAAPSNRSGSPPGDDKQKQEVATEAAEFVPRCLFAVGAGDGEKLDLQREPVLRWSNPTAGDVHGEVFVWTDHGSPAVVATYYRFFSPNWGSTLEITSCTDKEASATLDGVRFWRTKQPGMRRKVLDDVEAPARTEKTRLIQMRRMAGEFVVRLEDTRTKVSGVKRELRLLNQPIFRNPPPTEKSTYLDGALFAFVEGTDPEVLLVFEAVESNGKAAWRYGLTRMNRDILQVTFRDAEVWSAPYLDDVLNRPRDPYSAFALRQRLQNLEPKPVEVKAGETKP